MSGDKPKTTGVKGPTAAFRAQAGKGRPKGVPNKVTADIRALAGRYGPKVLEILHEIAASKKSPAAARVAACRELLDRAYGKAPQPLALNPGNMADVFGKLIEMQPS